MRKIWVAYVWTRYEPGAPAIRGVHPTLENAKIYFDDELERAGKEPLEWTDYSYGSSANVGDLSYEIEPVKVYL